MHWREKWDDEATRELKEFNARPVSELLSMVRKGQYGSYHTIWDSITERASLQEAGWHLFNIVSPSDGGMFDLVLRYHAATALIKILALPNLEGTDFTVEWRGASKNIAMVRSILEEKIGAHD